MAVSMLRYVVTTVTMIFDLPRVDFFLVEEVGEFALAWMTMLGAAVGVVRGAHFNLHVLTHRFSSGTRRAVARLNAALIVAFGGIAAYFGWHLAVLNGTSATPGLQINMFWLYLSPAVAGVLIVIYGLIAFVAPPEGGH